MALFTYTGFGASIFQIMGSSIAPVPPAFNDIMVRYILSQGDVEVSIRKIGIGMFGHDPNDALGPVTVPLYVFRTFNNGPAGTLPLPPLTLRTPGSPISVLSTETQRDGLELVWTGAVEAQETPGDYDFAPGILAGRDGQLLMAVCGTPMTNNPLNGNAVFVSMSVLGDAVQLRPGSDIPGARAARSMPRWDVELSSQG